MSTNPSENSRVYMGFVVDRDDPTNTGGHKIFCPQIHGKDVDINHLPYCRFSVAAGAGHAGTNQGALDNGQAVWFKKDKGEGGTGLGTIVGLPQTKRKADPSMPGNVSLITYLPQIQEALNKESPIRVRPKVEEKMENGARVRAMTEKGQMHKHSLLNELSSAGASFPLNGTILPQITNISTGVEQSMNILTSAMQGSFPGMAFSLSNIMDLLPQELKDKLPQGVTTALNNTTALMGSVSTMSVDGAMSGGLKIDPLSFATTAANLISTATNSSDVANIISELQSNPALSGLPELSLSTTIKSPFGDINVSINPATGAMESLIPDSIQKAIDAFGSLMGGIPGAGGGSLFGDSTKVISDMGQRLAKPELVSKFKQKMEQNMSTAMGTDARKAMNEIGSTTNSFAVGAKKFLG